MIDDVLRNYRTAAIDARLKATLGFLEKLTLKPWEVNAEDMRALQDAGVDAVAIREAMYVCFLFDFITRCADAFDFDLPRRRGERWIGRVILWIGYDSCLVHG